MKTPSLAFIVLISAPMAAHAHPTGHSGGIIEEVEHLLSSPDHLLALLALALLVGIAIWRVIAFRKGTGKL